ncbi:hypothetical protein GCM10009828_101560 [Actinoplanes couchii]|uniref:Uncharacterized protein n=1 Tax=Actinoplanes couchii TaxID=403638 RepID=A0ABQ3XLN5_9ACTN|nr:hypothetical protein Aco03nite_078330 [Actinoplanes couchii]
MGDVVGGEQGQGVADVVAAVRRRVFQQIGVDAVVFAQVAVEDGGFGGVGHVVPAGGFAQGVGGVAVAAGDQAEK